MVFCGLHLDDSAVYTYDASLFCRAAKAMEVEKHNILQEMAEEAELAEMEMKAKLKQKHIDEIGKELDKVQNPTVLAHSALLLGSDFLQSSAAEFFAWVRKALTRLSNFPFVHVVPCSWDLIVGTALCLLDSEWKRFLSSAELLEACALCSVCGIYFEHFHVPGLLFMEDFKAKSMMICCLP